jgi:N-acetylneuraminic acid mutarotase
MQAVVKKGLLASAVCVLLAACHGSDNSTPSTIPPTIGTFSWQAPVTTTTGISVTFNDTGASTSDGSTPTYSWVFGDQTPTGSTQATTGIPVTHIYAQPGVYQVTLTVTDDHGTSVSQVKSVNVTGTPVTTNGVESWAWLSGSKYANSAGDYQTLLQPSASNQPSGRQNAATWVATPVVGHPSGQFVMFGGYGYDSTGNSGALNDLWAYDPVSQQWTWLSGSNRANSFGTWPKDSSGNILVNTTAPSNVVSARTAMAQWVDPKTGNFWIFGGSGFDANNNSGYLSDMWMLNHVTGEATYIGGQPFGNAAAVSGTQGVASAANVPGNRAFPITWVDKNGVFWMFGGQGYNGTNIDSYNDLWSYDPKSQLGWILVGGSATASNTAGTYGTLGVAAATNAPGARVSAQTWVDNSGNLWMFGGNGYDSAGTYGALNDLWMYNPKAGWTWVSGSNIAGATSVYGNKDHSTPVTAGTPNVPGARVGTVGWVDSSNNFWLFGGSGSDSTSTTSANDGGGALNELWTFNTTTKTWTWMGGINVAGTPGVYITQYPSTTGSPYNSPGSRVWSSSWVDSSGNFWMYGGVGLDSVGTSGYLNDLWTVQLTVPSAP